MPKSSGRLTSMYSLGDTLNHLRRNNKMKCITCPYAIWDKDMIIGCKKEDCNGESAIYDY